MATCLFSECVSGCRWLGRRRRLTAVLLCFVILTTQLLGLFIFCVSFCCFVLLRATSRSESLYFSQYFILHCRALPMCARQCSSHYFWFAYKRDWWVLEISQVMVVLTTAVSSSPGASSLSSALSFSLCILSLRSHVVVVVATIIFTAQINTYTTFRHQLGRTCHHHGHSHRDRH